MIPSTREAYKGPDTSAGQTDHTASTSEPDSPFERGTEVPSSRTSISSCEDSEHTETLLNILDQLGMSWENVV